MCLCACLHSFLAIIACVDVLVCLRSVLGCLQDNDTYVRRNAAIAIREVVKHSEELAAIVNKAGGAAALVEYANGANGGARLAAVMALGTHTL